MQREGARAARAEAESVEAAGRLSEAQKVVARQERDIQNLQKQSLQTEAAAERLRSALVVCFLCVQFC